MAWVRGITSILASMAIARDALDKFVRWPESSLERSERLEQLRFLENGVPIYVAETPFDTVGVDTEEDVRRVEEILRESRGRSTVRLQRRNAGTGSCLRVSVVHCCELCQCDFAQASAAATRLVIAGCECKSHSTQRDGVFSARFCSANLFIDEIKGSTLATDWKQ